MILFSRDTFDFARRPDWLKKVAWVGLGLLIAQRLHGPLQDPDLWWHLAVGREIISSGALLRHDVFSHPLAGRPWINGDWLIDVVAHAGQHAFGFGGLWLARLVVGLALYGVVALGARRLLGGSPVAFLLVFLGTVTLGVRPLERPETVSLLCLAMLILIFQRARRHETVRRGGLVGLVLIQTVWVNSHGAFAFGPIAAGLLWLGALAAREDRGYSRWLLISTTLLSTACLANPWGWSMFTILTEHAAQWPDSRTLIAEWAFPHPLKTPAYWGLFLLTAGVLGNGLRRGQRDALFWAPLVAGFGALTFSTIRSTAYLPIVALPALADALGPATLPGRDPVSRTHRGLWALCCLAVPLQIWAWGGFRWRGVVEWSRWPVRACRFVDRAGLAGNMFNAYDDGGFLTWYFGRRRPDFIDGRYLFQPLLVRQSRMLDAVSVPGNRNPWPDFLGEHHIEFAVVPDLFPDHEFFETEPTPFPLKALNVMFPRRGWSLVYWDERYYVFVRRNSVNQRVVDERGAESLWPYNPEQTRFLLSTAQIDRTRMDRDMARHNNDRAAPRAPDGPFGQRPFSE